MPCSIRNCCTFAALKGDIMGKFIPQQGYYRNLRAYQVSEVIYDITYIFVKRFLSRGDRTVDQMVQAARSGKQNIAEGSAAGSTSKESEIKLTNVAKASLQELLLDYEDYLRVRNLQQWDKDSAKAIQTRRVCANHNESSYYRDAVSIRSDETVANIAIILIHQADLLLARLIERQKRDFLAEGGIREQMSRARKAQRTQSYQSFQSTPSAPSDPKK
jgi:four helix bundle suffix protein